MDQAEPSRQRPEPERAEDSGDEPERAHGSEPRGAEQPGVAPPDRAAAHSDGGGRVTEGVRIAAVEAAVAAGLAPSTSRAPERPRAAVPPAEGRPAAGGRAPDGSVGGRVVLPGDGADPEVPSARWTQTGANVSDADAAAPYELPDWSDPPTGQVPRILLDDAGEEAGSDPVLSARGPSWREAGSDWDGDIDLSFLAEQAGAAGPRPGGFEDFEFSFAELETEEAPLIGLQREPGGTGSAERTAADEEAAWQQLMSRSAGDAPVRGDSTGRSRRSGAGRVRRRAAGKDPRSSMPSRSDAVTFPRRPAPSTRGRHAAKRHLGPAVEPPAGGPLASGADSPTAEQAPPAEHGGATATLTPGPPGMAPAGSMERKGVSRLAQRVLTGAAAGGVALAAFVAGPLASLVLVTIVVTLATGELLGALRRRGFRPVAPVALLAAPACLIASYAEGAVALIGVLAATTVASWCYLLLVPGRRAPAADAGVTLLATVWIGVLGGYAGALLAPGTFSARHGLAVLAVAALLTVGNDVGALLAGSRLGRHLLAPSVSPGKTWEGVAGGSALTMLLAGFVAARVHPLGLGHSLVLGAVVCALAPLGDLAESLVKRDLGLKDMGDLLPAHGGVLDRVDSLLFVLPASFYLALAWHLR